MKTYNKLVRDRIPGIIADCGKDPIIRPILSDDEYIELLNKKLHEELMEYQRDQTIEELADLLEVIYAAAAARGYTAEQLDDVREVKAAARGRFEKRILLVGVADKVVPPWTK